jgi:hypothetical protein
MCSHLCRTMLSITVWAGRRVYSKKVMPGVHSRGRPIRDVAAIQETPALTIPPPLYTTTAYPSVSGTELKLLLTKHSSTHTPPTLQHPMNLQEKRKGHSGHANHLKSRQHIGPLSIYSQLPHRGTTPPRSRPRPNPAQHTYSALQHRRSRDLVRRSIARRLALVVVDADQNTRVSGGIRAGEADRGAGRLVPIA